MLQHCLEVECLCIDLADRENREIFHMFISRMPWNKQPSLCLSVLPTQGPASAGYKNPSVSRWASIIVAKAHSLKDSYSAPSLFVLLPALFIHQICTRCSKKALHHLFFAGARAALFRKPRPVLWSEHIFNAGVLRTTRSDRLKTHFHIKVKTLVVQCKNMNSGDQYQLDYMSNI